MENLSEESIMLWPRMDDDGKARGEGVTFALDFPPFSVSEILDEEQKEIELRLLLGSKDSSLSVKRELWKREGYKKSAVAKQGREECCKD